MTISQAHHSEVPLKTGYVLKFKFVVRCQMELLSVCRETSLIKSATKQVRCIAVHLTRTALGATRFD